MEPNMQQRYEKFSKTFVNEFEMYIEVQRLIFEESTKNSVLKDVAVNSVKDTFKCAKGIAYNSEKEISSSLIGLGGKMLFGIKDYILVEKKLDIAGKMIKLVDKYEKPEAKKVLREMLVRVAYELFRSFEYQFMHAERTRGGWSQAMLQLARTAVWCFMQYYKFSAREDLDEQYILEAVTLKNMPKVNILKKLYYTDDKKFTKVTNTEDHLELDGVKILSKAGIALYENEKLVFYKNNLTKPEKYHYRRIFSHETNETIKNEFTKEVKEHPQMKYKYILNMETVTKDKRCEKVLEDINRNDDDLMEVRLKENMERLIKNAVENLICEMMDQMVAAIKGISLSAAGTSSTSVVNNRSTVNENFVSETQNAEVIVNEIGAEFQGHVHISF